MNERKTRENESDPAVFIAAVPDARRRRDAESVCALMERVTRRPPRMWGTSIVGFGAYRRRYADGREDEWPLTAFSPRKQALTLYIMSGFSDYAPLLARLGKHRTGKACLYVGDLRLVDEQVLARLIRRSVAHLRATRSTR